LVQIDVIKNKTKTRFTKKNRKINSPLDQLPSSVFTVILYSYTKPRFCYLMYQYKCLKTFRWWKIKTFNVHWTVNERHFLTNRFYFLVHYCVCRYILILIISGVPAYTAYELHIDYIEVFIFLFFYKIIHAKQQQY
jgi:hypothetical protein